jgi:hypothetical protein
MRRQFRLKKEYPGCFLKVGDIQSVLPISKTILSEYENYPEFWEEIIEVPEYVECLGPKNSAYSHKFGRIYRIENGKISCEPEGSPTGWEGYNSGGWKWKKSTKAEYDAQQNPYTVLTYQQVDGGRNLFDLNSNKDAYSCRKYGTLFDKKIFTNKNPIISIKDNKTGTVYRVGELAQQLPGNYWVTIKALELIDNKLKITFNDVKVMRKDKVEFAVGDKITYLAGINPAIIDCFKDSGEDFRVGVVFHGYYAITWVRLEDIEHYKEPIKEEKSVIVSTSFYSKSNAFNITNYVTPSKAEELQQFITNEWIND